MITIKVIFARAVRSLRSYGIHFLVTFLCFRGNPGRNNQRNEAGQSADQTSNRKHNVMMDAFRMLWMLYGFLVLLASLTSSRSCLWCIRRRCPAHGAFVCSNGSRQQTDREDMLTQRYVNICRMFARPCSACNT